MDRDAPLRRRAQMNATFDEPSGSTTTRPRRSTINLDDAIRSPAMLRDRPSAVGISATVLGGRGVPLCFEHNSRFWVLGGPCISVLLLLGGRPTALVAAFGVMACYCFDLADHAEGAMLSLWLAVICSAGTLGWAGSALGAVYALNVVVFVGLVGVWATLQFRSIYRDDPDMARFLERILFACFPLPTVAILTWTGVALGGAACAAPCLALAMYAALALYAAPLRSALGGDVAGGVRGDTCLASLVLCGCMLVLPATVQIAIEHRLLVWGTGAAMWRSILKVSGAAALPWPLLLMLRRKGVLRGSRRGLDHALRNASVVAVVVLCETSKSLVLLPAVRPFLYSAPRPPFDSMLASAALYFVAAAWVVQGTGGRAGVYTARALMVGSVRCIGMLLGVEQSLMPMFDLSALALSTLTFTGRRGLRSYVVGVVGTSSLILWFFYQTVWHLSYNFALPFEVRSMKTHSAQEDGFAGAGGNREQGIEEASLPLSLSLQTASVCCSVLSLLILLVPGLAGLDVRQSVVGLIFGMHSIALLLLEMIFVGAEARDPRQLKGLFPLPLTAVTGFLGACMAVRLLRDEGIELPHLWLPGSVNGGKALACLLVSLAPTGSESSASVFYLATIIPVVVLVMASTAPFILFGRRSQASDASSLMGNRAGRNGEIGDGRVGVGRSAGGAAGGGASPPSMVPWEGGVCVFFMASALWVCSGPVISPLLGVLLGKSSGFAVGGSGTGSAHVMAFCGVILGIYVLTMVSKHFPDSRTGRRTGAALFMTSTALLVLKPAVLNGVRGWGAGGGSDLSWRESVKETCGVAIAGVIVLALTGAVSPTKTLARRAVFAMAVGGSVGTWSAVSSMPRADSVTVALSALGAAGTFSCALMILLETAVPRPALLSRSSNRHSGGIGEGEGGRAGRRRVAGILAKASNGVLPELYVTMVSVMPLAGLTQAMQLLAFGPVGRSIMGLPGRGGGVNAQGAARFALVTAATGHAVTAIVLKFIDDGFPSEGGGGRDGRVAGISRRGRSGMAAVSRANGEARWVPVMGNTSALLAGLGAFLCCWDHFPGEASRALGAIPCCALLLLLREDGRLLSGTGFEVAVPMGALSLSWVGSSVYYIFGKGMLAARRYPSKLIGSWLFGGLLGQAVGAYHGALHHFHGVYGGADSRRHGEVAVALRAVSFWTAESPWQPLWNFILLVASVPAHVHLAAFLWGGQGSLQRSPRVIAALAINAVPMVAGDLTSINLMGLMGLVGGCVQLWLTHERQATGRRFI